MSRSSKSIRNLNFALMGQGIGLIISFIARIVFIRILGSEYLGLNGLFSNILTVLSLTELGVGEAIIYSLYKPLSEKDYKKCQMLMQLYKKLYTIIGILIFSLGLAVTPFLSYLINDMPKIDEIYTIFILFVVNSSVSYFFSYKRNLIIADQNRYIATIYRYIFYILLNVFQIVFLIITKNYILFLILQIIFTLIENFLISTKANKMYPFLNDKKKILLDAESKKEIIKNTKALMMHKIGGIIVSATDNILLSKFAGLVEVAIYSNYYLIINALNIIYGQFYSSITASVGNLCVEHDGKYQYKVFKKVDFIGFVIFSFSALCLINLFNPFIIYWLGKEYIFEFNIVLVLVINFYVAGMRKSVLTFREASGLFYRDRWKGVFEAIVNFGASIIFINFFGVIGVFLGTLFSSLAVCSWLEPFVLYKFGFRKSVKEYFKNYAKYVLFTIFVCYLSFNVCSFVSIIGFWEICVKLIICCFIYFILLFLFFKKNENYIYLKEFIFKTIKSIISIHKS